MGVAGGVVSDQADADEDMSVKQRLLLAAGSTLTEGSDLVGDQTDIQLVAEAIEVTGQLKKISIFASQKAVVLWPNPLLIHMYILM